MKSAGDNRWISDRPRRIGSEERHCATRSAGAVLLGAALTLVMVGCGSPKEPIFEPLDPPLCWPGPPLPPRIRYVGELSTNADLKAGKTFGEALGELFFGKKPIHTMLSPYAATINGKERLLVADSNGQIVHMFDLERREYAQWRPPAPLRFSQPVGIAYDMMGRVIVSDSVAGLLWIFSGEGEYLGTMGEEQLVRPAGVAVDELNDRIIVADVAAHQIVVLDKDGELIRRLGRRGTELGQFNYPTNVAVDDDGRIYVADSLNSRIQQFSPLLEPIRQIGERGDMPGYFSMPKGIAIDSDNHLYIVDAHFESVQIYNPEGDLLLDFGEEGNGPGEFWLPAGVTVDREDRVWVADTYNRRIQVFQYLNPEAAQEAVESKEVGP